MKHLDALSIKPLAIISCGCIGTFALWAKHPGITIAALVIILLLAFAAPKPNLEKLAEQAIEKGVPFNYKQH